MLFALVCCPVIFGQPPSSPAPVKQSSERTDAEKGTFKQWEYKTVHSDAELNDLVSKGWEFVTMSSDGQGQHYLVKRAKSTAAAQTASGVPEGVVYHAGNDVLPPVIYRKIEPSYTPAAYARHIEGIVTLYLEVKPDGTTDNIRVTKSLDPGLDQKAIEAVRQWRFRPGTKAGKPVTVAAIVDVNFQLL
jgi:TonB family protein